MATIVTRSGKGSALTFAEGDANFTNLNNELADKIALTDLSVTTATAADTSALAYNNTTGVLTFTPVETADFAALDDLSVTTAAASGAGSLSYNNSTGVFTFAPVDTSLVLTSLADDTTPQLGGDLDVNGNIIVSASNGDIDIEPNGSGNVSITTDTGGVNISTLLSYDEMIRTNNSTSGSITLDHESGPIDYIVQTGDLTVTGLTTPTSGANVTLVLNNSGGTYTISFDETNSTFYGVDGEDPTLTGFDVINLLCLDDTADAEVYIVTHVGDLASI